jgi:hypothetical protein
MMDHIMWVEIRHADRDPGNLGLGLSSCNFFEGQLMTGESSKEFQWESE